MDRTVPQTGSEEIELYMRTYYSLLRSTRAIKLESLVESHMAMESSLHVAAREAHVDISALVYASLRLPSAITEVNRVLLGQLEDLLEVSIPLGDLPEDARAWERGVDELAEEDEDVADYVRSLEEARDTTELPEASGEAIAREFERYLRRRGEGGPL